MKHRFKLMSLAFTLIVSSIPCLTQTQQSEPIVIGRKVGFHSNILQEDRTLWISEPAESNSSSARYPVMVLLDAESHFIHATGIVQFFSDAGRMPEMYVVGIESTDRVRDFTPASSETSMPGGGGADSFLKFISDELAPFIDTHYRTAPFRIIVGHSLGGTFALHALLSNPRVFNAYFILSPNLWWGNDTLVSRLEVFLKQAPKMDAYVYETHTTKESPKNIDATKRLTEHVHTIRVDGLNWKIQLMPDESHGSIVHRSIYDGLEFVFSSWETRGDLSVLGMTGLQQHYKELSRRYGYEIDPPENLVNGLGYQSLYAGKNEEAISIFKWNVQHYPASSNVYDSLGEAYAKQGDTTLALENYKKSVGLNSKNTAAIEIMKKLNAQKNR